MARKPNRGIEALADRLHGWLEANGVRGRSRARKQRDVAKMLGTTTRHLQEAAIVLNDRGVAVVSSCKAPMGIYLAEQDEELAAFSRQLVNRIRGLARRLKPVRRIVRERIERRSIEPSGQRRLFT